MSRGDHERRNKLIQAIQEKKKKDKEKSKRKALKAKIIAQQKLQEKINSKPDTFKTVFEKNMNNIKDSMAEELKSSYAYSAADSPVLIRKNSKISDGGNKRNMFRNNINFQPQASQSTIFRSENQSPNQRLFKGNISIKKFLNKNHSFMQRSLAASPKNSQISSEEQIPIVVKSPSKASGLAAKITDLGAQPNMMKKLVINFSGKSENNPEVKFRRRAHKLSYAKFIPRLNLEKTTSKALPLNSKTLASKPSFTKSKSLNQYQNFKSPNRIKKVLFKDKKLLNNGIRIKLSRQPSPQRRLRPKSRGHSVRRPLSKMQFSKFKRIDSALKLMHQSLYDFKGTLNNCIKNTNRSFRKNFISCSTKKIFKKKKHKPFEPFPIEDYLDQSIDDQWGM
ncbi:unnamed protein product [Moneuplotes crassus]|uniref:Uncharacterized protein n=1 Tax=Euplotes crassus TaxID=5936 RepID=A0AAD1UIB1_EUPCR|nr:unnamed protein product [Moneuplotes crassus]